MGNLVKKWALWPFLKKFLRSIYGEKTIFAHFFGQLPTFKIKNGQQFLPNLLGFLGVVAKNPLFSLINCEEKIYIFIIISQKKWANGQKHKNKAFLKKEDVI